MKILPSSCSGCPAATESPEISIGIDRTGADYVVALAGNPNTGKSTVFNALTGLRQHTGNWPGKTVTRAEGRLTVEDRKYLLVDLPGTYSLLATSYDEEVARDFLLFGQPDVTLVVVDATRLHRNLNLVLQVLEITDRVVVCLNLMDEAERHGVTIDHQRLSQELGVPVVPTSARFSKGLDRLIQTMDQVATGVLTCQPTRIQDWSPQLKAAVQQITKPLKEAFPQLPNASWVAMRLLDGDQRMAQGVLRGELGKVFDERTDSEAETPNRQSETVGPLSTRQDIMRLASSLRWDLGPGFHESLVETIFANAARIADAVTTRPTGKDGPTFDATLDRILTNRWTGFPVMFLMLAFILWITIVGANYPSRWLSSFLLDTVYFNLKSGAAQIGMTWWLSGLLIDGAYKATAWVVAVMLPPMAIFFPLFTLLEDFGYLPRVAFNLDGIFRRVGSHGKQALTMCMGLGCNAAGVVATRIIESPRERLIAIITNNFSLCNGRWPTQILLATIFFGALAPPYLAGIVSAGAVMLVTLLGILLTFLTSWGLSRTVLRGEPSTFHLELPPYRPPRLLQTLYTSLVDRTMFVLWRAVVFAVPAGAVIWLMCNVPLGNASVAEYLVNLANPIGLLFGLNGVILLAYVVAIPANEIVIPTILMLTVLVARIGGVGEGAGVIFESGSNAATREVLLAGQWTVLTATNVMLFSLIHNPCSTTIYTIWKETRSVKWTVLSVLLPLVMGLLLCFVVAQLWRLGTV